MYLQIGLSVSFAVLLTLHLSWCLFIAYPLVLDKFIKRGVFWLYLPLKWKGPFRTSVSVLTPVLFWAVLLSGFAAVWILTHSYPYYYFAMAALGMALCVYILHSVCLKLRFRQQQDA